MTPTKNQIVIIGIVIFVIIILLFMILGIIPGLKSNNINARKNITATLNIWGLQDSKKDLEPIITSFNAIYPKIQINYRRFSNFSEYNKKLLNALASEESPDIFVIRNTDLPSSLNKLYPAPKKLIPNGFIKQTFPNVVQQDFVQDGTTYALPISIDTLSLFYNRDLLDQKAVAVPKNWDDFIKIIPKLTKFDSSQNIITSGAAIGGSTKSIPEASDILSLLMLQNGTKMVSPDFTSITFDSKEGENALNFYTQFANNRNQLYCWNDSLDNNLDMFAQEKTAMILSYFSSVSKIQKRNAFLNFEISEIPQPKDNKKSVSYANYYGYAVSKQSKYKNIAWELLAYTFTNQSVMRKYVEKTKRPPALSNLLRGYKDDINIGVFARQALTARSWPQIDADYIRKTFSKAIESVNSNILTVKDALHRAKNEINSIMK